MFLLKTQQLQQIKRLPSAALMVKFITFHLLHVMRNHFLARDSRGGSHLLTIERVADHRNQLV